MYLSIQNSHCHLSNFLFETVNFLLKASNCNLKFAIYITNFHFKFTNEFFIAESKDYKNIYAPQNNISTQAGNTVRLQCRSSGQKIFWSRQNHELPKSHRLGADYLELSRVHPSDSGRYICQVRDSQGEDSYDYIDLHVSGRLRARGSFGCREKGVATIYSTCTRVLKVAL